MPYLDGPAVRAARRRKAWTQESLAERTGLALRTIKSIEQVGGHTIDRNPSTAHAIARALAVDVTEILGAEARDSTLVCADATTLTRLRQSCGLSTTAVEDQASLEQGAASAFESGQRSPTIAEWLSLAAALSPERPDHLRVDRDKIWIPAFTRTGDREADSIGEALRHDLHYLLGQTGLFPVIDRTVEDPRPDIRYRVDGRILRRGTHWALETTLVDAEQKVELWSKRYPLPTDSERGILGVESLLELRADLAALLPGHRQAPTMEARVTSDLCEGMLLHELTLASQGDLFCQAIDLYDRAHSENAFEEAARLFEQYTQARPFHEAPLFYLGRCHYLASLWGSPATRQRSLDAVRDAAERCLAARRSSPRGQLLLALHAWAQGQSERALSLLITGLGSHHCFTSAYSIGGQILGLTDQPELALAFLGAAQQLSSVPLPAPARTPATSPRGGPRSLHPITEHHGLELGKAIAHFARSDYESAIQTSRGYLALHPDSTWPHMCIAASSGLLRDPRLSSEAVAHLETIGFSASAVSEALPGAAERIRDLFIEGFSRSGLRSRR